MRKNFVLFVLIPLLVVAVVVYLFIDRWIEAGLETAGEAIVGAKVEIDNLHLSLSPLGIRFSRMQVANPRDPWKNLFETGTVQFAMNFGQLLRAKYIIETMEINDLILGTKRTTDGSLPAGRKTAEEPSSGGPSFSAMAQDLLDKSVEKTPLYDIAQLRKGINIDSLIKAQDFLSVRHIDTLKARATTATQQWQGIQTDLEKSRQQITEISRNVQTINPSQLKSPDQIVAAISTADNAYKSINETVATLNTRKESVAGEIKKIAAAVDSIDDLARQDLQKVKTLVRLPDLKTSGIAEALLGRTMLEDVHQYMEWIDFARTHVRRYQSKPEMEKPVRMRGQNIHFPVERAYPKLWIQKALISGGTDRKQDPDFMEVRGEVRNITNDQTVTGLPMTAALDGSRGTDLVLALKALFDRTKDLPLDEYHGTVSGIRLAEVKLGRSDFLPSSISEAHVASGIDISIPGTRFDGRMKAQFRNLTMKFGSEPRSVGERIARQVLQGVHGFDVTLRLWNTQHAFDMAFATDLDDQFARGLKDALGAELTRLEGEIRGKVEARVAEKRKEFEALYTAKRQEAEKQLAAYQKLVNDNLAIVDAKKAELTAQLEKQKKGLLDDAVNKLFKK